ncbi:spindle pole body component 110-like, partial [Piliocolobus tephrosceles]|uniref:spindle pole body component 110-like n=1 Tax=Piliocolobus tephrosceles TaxID=591936 RepID=UPI000E6AFB11
EREKYDKKRQKIIFDLQQEKNENIKKLLAGYNEKILNIQNYFRLILDDQLGIIHALEDDNLIKTKIFFSKKKYLEELKKSIFTDGKKLDNLDRDVTLLKKDVTYYEKLKTDLKKIKNKRKKQQSILTELKLETDVKKMLFIKLCKQYEDIYNKNKMELYNNIQQMLLENHILETRIKIQNKKFEINNLELEKWKESLDINQNEVLNNFLQNKFQNFEVLKKEVEDLIDVQQKNKENYEAILHLNYVPNEDLDILKREENVY